MKRKLFVIGHADTPTGYARVMHSVLPYLIEDFEVHHFALNINTLDRAYPWTIYPNPNPLDAHGLIEIERLVRSLQPEVVMVSTNHYYLPLVADKIRVWSPDSRLVAYLPVEGDRIRKMEMLSVAQCDVAVVFTKFGRDTLKQEALRHGMSPSALPPIHIIPHGLDRDLFTPLVITNDQPDLSASRTLARKQLWPGQPEMQKAFIVLNGNRNQASKRIDLTLKGFAQFAENKPPSVKLYLNMARYDLGNDIGRWIHQLKLQDRVIVARRTQVDPAHTTEELNRLYNACDVGINTSMGEGWGLVPFEHAATGKPQIIAANSMTRELWENNATLLEPESGSSEYAAASQNPAVSPEGVAEELERLYSDQNHYRQQAKSAWKLTVQDRFDWEVIGEQWAQLLESVAFHPGEKCENYESKDYLR